VEETTMGSVNSIGIIGAGAMGSFYASKLYGMDEANVSFIARDERYEKLKENGLVINGKSYFFDVINPDREPVIQDLLIVAVKHHHLPRAIEDIRNVVGRHTQILSVMNGIDSEESIGAVYGMERVLYGVALGIDAVRHNNNVTYSKEGILYFGEAVNDPPSDRVQAVKELFDRAGIVSEVPGDMIRVLWRKFMINVGVNQISAVLRAPYGVFVKVKEAGELMEAAMREAMAIADKAGVDLREQDIQDWYSVMANLSPNGKTSMLQDIEDRRKTEVEMFAGRVMELGRRYGVLTPVNDLVFKIIKVLENS